MKHLILLFSILLSLSSLNAESFVMDRYSVSIDVDSARSLHYSEVMDLDFAYPSHGIIRDIQYRFPGYDGYPDTVAEVSDIKANVPLSIDRSSSFIDLRLGDADRLLSGKQSFSITYDFGLGKDYYDEYDELYINIVSANGWNTLIRSVFFSVSLPFPVDADRIWVTYGRYGSSSRLPVHLSEDGLTITGEAYNLAPGEALTLRVEMDEGYFADARNPYSVMYIMIAIGTAFSILAVLLVLFLYFRHGRDEKLIYPVSFHPPVGITPMDVSFIDSGSIDDAAVGAMLFYWADKGYVRIDETARGSYTFSVVLWPQDLDKREEALFSSFFSSSAVDGKALRMSGFAAKLKNIVIPEEGRYFSGERALYSQESVKAKRKADAAAVGLAIVHAVIAVLLSGSYLLMPCAVLSFMAFAASRTLSSAKALKAPLIAFTAFFMFFVGFGFCTVLSSAIPSAIAVAEAAVFMISLFAVSAITSFISKRSKYCDDLKGKIEGFREFIDKTERDKIEKLSEDDPRYFYHVLSYAMVFGLADKWCGKFRGITVEDVSWYNPYGGVGDIMAYAYFSRAWRSMYRSSVMPGNSGGRGSGGGRPTFSGFSGRAGGGFSGGGGRSW